MPVWFMIALPVVVLACIGLVAYQIKDVRLKRRNLEHWKKDEPLEGDVDRWD